MIAPKPTEVVANIAASTPFVGPETLERQMGKRFELRLGANESLFGPSPLAVEAMKRATEQAQFYGDPEGWELRSEIALRNGCSIENVVLASGIDELLMLFCRAYAAPGDSVLTTEGSYPTFEYAARSVGAAIEFAHYRNGSLNLDELTSLAASRRPRIVYIANPDNPSGSWQELDLKLPEETLLLLDEAYADFAPLAVHRLPPFAIRLRTFSKGYGMAGIRVGYAICDPEQAESLNKIRMHFGVSIVAQAGALAALRDEEHLRRVVVETATVHNYMVSELMLRGFPSIPSSTNFLTVNMWGREAADRMLSALRQQGVFIRKPGKAPLDGHIRITLGPLPTMEEFLIRFDRCRDEN